MTAREGLLIELVDLEKIPTAVSFVSAPIADLLEQIRYRDFVAETTPGGGAGFYGLTLVTEEIKVDLFGSGLKVVFFAPQQPGDPASSFDLRFDYRWAILKYAPQFDVQSFDHSARALFQILLDLLDVTELEFVEAIAETLVDDVAPYQVIVDKLKTLQAGGGTPLSGLSLANLPADMGEAEHIIAQIEAAPGAIDAYLALFKTVVDDANDLEHALDNVAALFRRWLGEVSREDIEALLVPQFSLELKDVRMALEAPRDMLIPLLASGAPDPNINIKSRVTFSAGALRYDPRSGFDIDLDQGVLVEFTPSMIPGFGLTLHFQEIKIDLSDDSDIAEVAADLRPAGFKGAYVGYAKIGLPPSWFSSPSGASLAIVGRNLLFGTGGFSGEIGLEALVSGAIAPTPQAPPANATLDFVFGPEPTGGAARQGFTVGFSSFVMRFHQNALMQSAIKGRLTVPQFNAQPVDIELYLDRDGDFELTASIASGHAFKFGTVFTFTARKLKVGRDNARVFIEASGDLSFEDNPLLKLRIKDPIALQRFRINSDGGFSIEGGSIPLPESTVLSIGPADVAVTAIHFGALQQDYQGQLREYHYFGFDARIDVSPGGVGGKGDGIKYYFTTDGGAFHDFIRIEGLGIDLVIPGSASKEQAVLLLKGYLALKSPEYEGSLEFIMPQAQIAGGASMRYNTDYPAWIVDARLELPVPLPLAATGLGLFGFRGLFGLRYNAEKAKVGLDVDASWGDFYRAPDSQGATGLTVFKLSTPTSNAVAKTPFSIGAGVSLATINDDGKAFSSQLFLLASIPNLILLEGRFDVMAKKRVGLTGDDPPYYAYVALAPKHSLEIGAGVDYRLPKDTGATLDMHATLEAAYFFQNRSAWYLNVGTKAQPTTARVVSLFDAYSYLMLSASGIEAGAGVHYDFHKKYGPVSVDAHAYLDIWVHVSFERAQAGGGVALGGYLDIRLLGFGFYISLAAVLTAEVPKPFRIAGSVEICVSVNLKVKKITKCFTVSFTWDKDSSVDLSPVPLLGAPGAPPIATGVHMHSGRGYPLQIGDQQIAANAVSAAIPLDTFIDIKFSKPLDPGLSEKITGYTNPASDNVEVLPPRYGSRIVEHVYALKQVVLETWSAKKNAWVAYHPFVALTPEAIMDGVANLPDPYAMNIGAWQKQDPTYGQIRLLAATPFSYMEPVGGYTPEQMGLDAATLFCVGNARTEHCVTWDWPATYAAGIDYYKNDLMFQAEGKDAVAVPVNVAPVAPFALSIAPGGRLILKFPAPTARARLILATGAPHLTIRYERRTPYPTPPGMNAATAAAIAAMQYLFQPPTYEEVSYQVVPRALLAAPLIYEDPNAPIDRIIVEPPAPNVAAIAALEGEIAGLQQEWYVSPSKRRAEIERKITAAQADLRALRARYCGSDAKTDATVVRTELVAIGGMQTRLQGQIIKASDELAEHSLREVAAEVAPRRRIKRETKDVYVGLAGKLGELQRHAERLTERAEALQVGGRAVAEAAPPSSRAAPGEITVGVRPDAGKLPEAWACWTFLREACWLSLEDWSYNQSIPGQAAIEADFSNMRAAIETTVAPIWRPDQVYRITLTVSNTITAPSGALPEATLTNYIHFKTTGAIGHFSVPAPSGNDKLATLSPPQSGQPLEDPRPETAERFLKYYIDTERSTPDPNGNLLYAKPVYYGDVKLQLFFTKPYALHFFAEWPAYRAVKGSTGATDLDANKYEIEMRVKDPAETKAPTTSGLAHQAPLITAAHLGQQSWVEDPAPRQDEDLKLLSNMRHPIGVDPGVTCWTVGGGPIKPAAKGLVTKLNTLEPDKLYTAVVFNKHHETSGVKEAEIARYPFKTSLYRDLSEHVASHLLEDRNGAQRPAVFRFAHSLGNAAQTYADARALITRPATLLPNGDFADWFDRLMLECLRVDLPAPPVSLEFNFLHNTASGETYALLIRSREALNDPRIPEGDRLAAMRVLVGGAPLSGAVKLFSRDCCQVAVMSASGTFPIQNLSFEFDQLSWNGAAWAVIDTAATGQFSAP